MSPYPTIGTNIVKLFGSDYWYGDLGNKCYSYPDLSTILVISEDSRLVRRIPLIMATSSLLLKVLDWLSAAFVDLSSITRDQTKLPAAGNVRRGGDGQKVAI